MNKFYNDCFGVHTFEISQFITGTLWNEIKNKWYVLAKDSKEKYFLNRVKLKNNYYELRHIQYKDIGVLAYLRWYDNGNGLTNYHRFILRINPRRLIGDDTYLGIFQINLDNLEKLSNNLDSVLRVYGFSEEDSIVMFTLSRIDVCVNFFLEDIEAYMKMLRKSKTPRGYTKFRDNKKKLPKGSVYFIGKNQNVQIYNKYLQLKKDGRVTKTEISEGVKQLARFEVQLSRKSIKNL